MMRTLSGGSRASTMELVGATVVDDAKRAARGESVGAVRCKQLLGERVKF